MSEIEFDSDEDDESWRDLTTSVAANLDHDWDAVTSLLPLEWQAKAYELGALGIPHIFSLPVRSTPIRRTRRDRVERKR